jgi:predicted metal-dependent hydrolase
MTQVLEIIRRRVRLAYEPARAKRWTILARSLEDSVNALSAMFPVGEAFFCRSVAHYRERITDPILREQVADFIFQEAMHSKEHKRFNEALREADVMGQEIETIARVMLNLTERLYPPITRLAVTCALEHCTTILSATLLERRALWDKHTDNEFGTLWLWHAAEEIEHKAVCFDVYEHIYGTGFWAWLHRVGVMGSVTLFGTIGVLVAFVMASVKGLKKRWRRGAKDAASGKQTGPRLRPIFAAMSWETYRDYYRRDFHPSKHYHHALLEAWKKENPGFGAQAGPRAA